MTDFSKYFTPMLVPATEPPAEPDQDFQKNVSGAVNSPENAGPAPDFSKYINAPAADPLDKTIFHTVAKTSTPETEAEIQQLYGQTGIPQDIIRKNLDAAKGRAEYSTLVADAQGAPKLLGFIQEPRNLAAIRKDVKPLSMVEATLAHQIKTDVMQTLEDLPSAWQRGRDVVTQGQLYSERGNLMLSGGDTSDVDARIKAFNETSDKSASKGGFLEATAEMLPMIIQAVYEGQAEGLKYATVGAATSLITGPAAPVSAAIMYGAGTTVGTIKAVFNMERGNALAEFQDIRDETGAPLNPIISNVASMVVGGANAILEYVGLKTISRVLPKSVSDKITGTLIRENVKKAITDPTIRKTLTGIGARYIEGISVETAQEFAQEWVNIIAGKFAKDFSGQPFDPEKIFTEENFKRAAEAGVEAFKASVVLGGAGVGVSTVNELKKVDNQIRQQQAFTEHQTAISEAIAATATAESNPVIMEKFLKETMGLKDQDAFVDPDVLLELSQANPVILDEIVQEMGASRDKILEAANQGLPIRMNMGAYHARLSPEAKAALFNGLKATPGSYSVAQIEAGLAQATDNFEDNYAGFVAENEALGAEISRIEQESLVAGADARVAAQTAQIAGRMAMSIADNTEGGNAVEILKKINIKAAENFDQKNFVSAESYDQALPPLDIPGMNLKFDGMFDRSALNKPPLYQFTPQSGPMTGRTVVVEEYTAEAVQAKLDKIAKMGNAEGEITLEKLIQKFSIDPEDVKPGEWGGRVLFHGTSRSAAKRILKNGVKNSKSTKGYFGRGFYMASDYNLASDNYADFAEDDAPGEVVPFKLRNTAKILDLRNENDWKRFISIKSRENTYESADNFDKIMVRNGVDGLFDRSFGGVVIYNPKVLLSPYAPITSGEGYQQGARGNVQIFDDRYLVNLFENANESTPFHELGHVFLAEMQNIISKGAATDQMVSDMQAIDTWLAVLDNPQTLEENYNKYRPAAYENKDFSSLTPAELAEVATVLKHEYFARSFEAYLMEGKAPAAELIPAFRRFARWLKKIYKHISALDVTLTPGIRNIFSRMLQSEQEVESSMNDAGLQPLTKAEMDALGILPEDRDYLKRLHQDAQTEAENALTAARLRGVRENRPEWEAAADDMIQRDLLNATVNRLRKGQGIDRQAAVETWGRAVIDRMPAGLKKIFKKGGMLPDEVAYEEGYKSAEQLFDALEKWKPEAQQKQEYVAQRAQEYQDTLNPDDFLVDTNSFAEYLGIIGNYTSGKLGSVAQLEEALAGKKGRKPVLARSAFKKYAKTIIRDMPVRDAVRTDLFTAAMKKASQGEAAAIKRGDWAAAQRANEQMRLNFEMAQEARRIRLEKEKIERLAKRVKKTKPGVVDSSYLGAALKLAQRFGLVELSDAYIPILDKAGEIKTLLVDETDMMGPDEYGFSTWLLEETKAFDYRDLNIDELSEVGALLKALVKKGRDKINPMLTSLDITLDQARDDLIAAASELKDKTKWAKRGRSFFGMDPTAWLRKFQDSLRSHYADTYQLWSMLRILDGFTYYTGDGAGPFETYFRDNLENAYAKKNKDTVKYEPLIRAAVVKLFKVGKNRRKMAVWLNDMIPVPVPKNLRNDGRQWDFEAVVSVALNMGNESNLLRLKEGYGWTDEDINAIVGVLTDTEWEAVQELWDIFEQMRPEFFAASDRIHGVEPPKIEPRAFTTPTGKVMKGGYAPAVYDHSNVRAAELDEKALLRESANAGHQRPSVNARATKSRAVSAGGMPIRLDLSGIARQFDYNLQYTAFAETIRDLARVLNDQDIADTIAAKVGEEWLPAMRNILSNVANPATNRNVSYATRLLKSLGANASKWVLGGNRSVGIKQLFSIPPLYTEGGSWHRGLKYIIKHPIQAWDEMLEASPNMQRRLEGRQIDREIASQREKLMTRSDLAGVPQAVIDGVLFAYIRFFDALATFPAWYGTKELMERKYGPGAKAILETDKIIFDTQPMSREMDLSTMQLDRNSLSRILTFFSGYTMRFENLKRVHVRGFLEGKISLGDFIFKSMLTRVLPPMLMNMLFTLGAGDEPDAEDVLWDILLYQVIGFPIVRELAVFAANAIRYATDDEFKGFSAFGSPIAAIPQALEWNMNTIARWFRGDEDDSEAAVAAVDLILATKGVPAVKIVKDLKESARQFDNSDGFDRWFKLLFKPDPDERE